MQKVKFMFFEVSEACKKKTDVHDVLVLSLQKMKLSQWGKTTAMGKSFFLVIGHYKRWAMKWTMEYTLFWYAFEMEPPFAIQYLSNEFCFTKDRDGPYTEGFPVLKKLRLNGHQYNCSYIVMPMSIVQRENEILLSMGENDCYSSIVKLDLQSILVQMHSI